jgi:effector-binding domain-containing protein
VGAGDPRRRTRAGGSVHSISEPITSKGRDPEIAVGGCPPRVAVLVHAGEYTAMPDTYSTLGAWVARNANYPGGQIREWCVVGPGRVAPSAYRTEIAWPIS